MERDAADELHVEMAHAQRANRSFAYCRKSLRQQRIELFACVEAFAETRRERCELVIVELLHAWFQLTDASRNLLIVLHLAIFAE